MPLGFVRYFGGDTLVRRDALAAVNGYNPALIAGEEPDMCRRMRGLGYRILHIDEPMTMHDIAIDRFSQYWKRAVRTGYAYAQISSIYAKTSDPLWRRQSRANAVRGACWIGGPPLAILLSLAFRSWLPLLIFLLAAALLWVRTGIRAVGRAQSLKVLIAYSISSHLQQIPVFIGQLRFLRGRARGHGSALIEYKEIP
jgi:cellulose synthase/poly-beta-1,6-N-acetylglucosamine synthase-like glycosyltransferase